MEIVTFVVKGSAKLVDPTDWQEHIQEGIRRVALCSVFLSRDQWDTSDRDHSQNLVN